MLYFKEITGCDEQIFISTTTSYSEGNNITTKNRCEGIKFTFKDINCTTSVMLLIIQVCKNTQNIKLLIGGQWSCRVHK